MAAADSAPVILNAQHFPLVPTHNDQVAVTAQVLNDDASGVTVKLHWRVCAAASPYTDPAFTVTQMFDDGAHADGLAGDSTFGVLLPAQANGAIVEFYFEALDGTGHTRFWPAPALDENLNPTQAQNCLYQVDDTVFAGSTPLYRLVMKPADWAEINQINQGQISGTPAAPYPFGPGEGHDQSYSHASYDSTWITFDGTGSNLNYVSDARNRGHGSRHEQPLSINVGFPNANTWKKITSLNLNTQTAYSQLFGSALLRKAGLTCPDSRAVQVRVNDIDPTHVVVGTNSGAPSYGSSYGFYAANELQDSDFLAHHFPLDSSGNIYRGLKYDFSVPSNTLSEADLTYRAPTGSQQPADPYRYAWYKEDNKSQDDWTDLIGLVQTLAKGTSDSSYNTSYTADYQTAVQAVVDVDEWMRFFAIETIIDNSETDISNGYGDDFYMYFGVTDPRAKFVPYDLDTICGQGSPAPAPNAHGLFRMINRDDGSSPAVMNSFIKFPAFAPMYYKNLNDQLNGAFATSPFNALCDEILTGVVPAAQITSIKNFQASRNAYLSTLIPLHISVTTGPAALNGYPHTTVATANLVGLANAITTRSVAVNGVAATWSAWQATWTANNVALNPGINRVLIQSFDSTSTETERLYYDIWYDKGSVTSVSGAVSGTWTPAGGPYQITASASVSSGTTLTIQPGTTIYLNSGINFSVANGGTLNAQGTDTQWIRFTRAPGTSSNWGNLTINGAVGSPQCQLAYIYFENNANNTGIPCIQVSGGWVLLDHLNFGVPGAPYLHLDSSAFLVTNCIFPTTSAAFEPLHGVGGIRSDHYGIMRDNFFGNTTGYNDIMDFTGGNRNLGQPIIQYYNNVMTGASDDMLDLDGTDAWIEHNIFLHPHKNGSADSASSVSGGSGGSDTSEITIIGNLFFDCDQTADAKQGNFYTFINNTIVHITDTGGTDTDAAVVIDMDAGTTFGKGFYFNGNIVYDAPSLVRNYDGAQTQITFDNNILPISWAGPGTGNTIIDPRLTRIAKVGETNFATFQAAQVLRQWFARSPQFARSRHRPNGRDKGGVIPIGASISGEPAWARLNRTTANLTVGPLFTGNGIPTGGFPNGSGYTHYKYRLDGGAFSAETPTTTHITLSGLSNGSHYVGSSVKTMRATIKGDPLLGPDATITRSKTWTVNTSYVPPGPTANIILNEVLTKNVAALQHNGTFPDLIELYNAGNASGNLAGMGVSDTPGTPYRYTIPAGTNLAPGAYLIIYADKTTASGELHTQFGLKDTGGSVTLTAAKNGDMSNGATLDSVTYGIQLPDLSIGRDATGAWTLCNPTFGSPNATRILGNQSTLVINEWLADANVLYPNDFIELYNPDPLPVALGGMYITNNPVEFITQQQLAPLSFIAGSGFTVLQADTNTSSGADHVDFKLTPTQGEIGLFLADQTPVDYIIYGPQSTDVSQGRSPNGSGTIVYFNQPTPGSGNPTTTAGPAANVVINEVLDVNQTLQNPDGSFAGWIELYNKGASAADISDMSLTNDVATPRKWVVPASTSIPSGGFLVVYGNPLAVSSATNTGFALNGRGDSLYLFASVANGASLQDSVVFGLQLPDFSVGRVPNGTGAFTLCVPTRGALNSGAGLGAASGIRLNEWLANPPTYDDSWFEIFNTGSQPVLLSGNYFTNDLLNRSKYLIPPLTFVGGAGATRWARIDADAPGIPNNGHVNFTLNAAGEGLGLFSGTGVQLEAVSFGTQAFNVSSGRFPDGSATIILMPGVATPGAANQAPPADSDSDGISDAWMMAHFGHPSGQAGDLSRAGDDPDGDGLTNLQEFLAGTDPRNPNSRLTATVTTTGIVGQMTIQFTAQANTSYTVQFKNTLSDVSWQKLTDVAPAGTTQAMSVIDTTIGANTARFYRVVAPAQP